jgi:L-asparaginase II
MAAVDLVEVWRGELLESVHRGHVVICGPDGDVRESWGDTGAVIYPRSSCKMVQALPLIESGAARAHGLRSAHLALACASHQGAEIHSAHVTRWLSDLGLGDSDLRCGPEVPRDTDARDALIRAGAGACRYHNNCSGKHAGFLTLGRHLKAGPEYHLIDHPVQAACKAAFEEVTGETSPGFGIDGCSAPNHATTLAGLGRAAAFFATAGARSDTRSRAAAELVTAMAAHPELVAGEGRACTALIRATEGRAVVKTGAEGVFVGIIPGSGTGVALKIVDGATRASEAVMAALLVRLGVLDAAHPVAKAYMNPPVLNRMNAVCGKIRTVGGLI